MQIIIASHSYMAEGIYDAAKMLSGSKNNVIVMKAYINSDNFETEFQQKMSEIPENEVVIVLTDLLGGSVNQVVMRYKGTHQMQIIAGINLYSVIKITQIDETKDIVEQLKNIVRQSEEQILYINDVIKNRKEKNSV
ncbi:MAG: hypothetical protein Q4C64_05725 [Erysipelotrichia bacterium]|nr:hypothetical protein [Erysipelotrichia bacterium]